MYKVIYNNMIIDVLKTVKYCRYLTKFHKTVSTDKTSANCIISSDGSQVYHIHGTSGVPEEYKTVRLVEINKEEFDHLSSLVIQSNPIPDDVQDDGLDDPIVLKQKISRLESEVELLTNCILEMSTVIYS